MPKYGDEIRRMFRNKSFMRIFRNQCIDKGYKIVESGYIPKRQYRNFGWKYGVIFCKPIKKGKRHE